MPEKDKSMRRLLTAALVATALLPLPAAADTLRPIPGYGAFSMVPDPFLKPDPALRYKVVFDVSQAPRTPGEVHQGLERVARMVNLLGAYGVRIQPGDIVITLHGQAAKTVLTPAAFAKRYNGAANPDAKLLEQLAAAGVSIRLCGQSMMGQGFTRDELNPVVKVDVAAITTMATLQLQGYAVIQD
jgi:intracellular sulfur oxidation DsrE/DsrF family protein